MRVPRGPGSVLFFSQVGCEGGQNHHQASRQFQYHLWLFFCYIILFYFILFIIVILILFIYLVIYYFSIIILFVVILVVCQASSSYCGVVGCVWLAGPLSLWLLCGLCSFQPFVAEPNTAIVSAACSGDVYVFVMLSACKVSWQPVLCTC